MKDLEHIKEMLRRGLTDSQIEALAQLIIDALPEANDED